MHHYDSGDIPLQPSQSGVNPAYCSLSAWAIWRQSWRLYQQNFGSYLMRSLRSGVWLLLPLLAGLAVFAALNQDVLTRWQIALGLIVSFVGLTGYYASASLLIRLGWRQLKAVMKPGPVAIAPGTTSHELNISLPWKKQLTFCWLSLNLSIVMAGVLLLAYVGLSVLLTILYFVLTFATGFVAIAVTQFQPSTIHHAIMASIVLILLLCVSLMGWIMLRFLLRFFLADAVLAIQPQATAWGSLRRSWQLTQRLSQFLCRLAALIWLGTLPLQIPAQLLSWGIMRILSQSLLSMVDRSVLAIAALLLGTWMVGVMALPLWQIAKALLYQTRRSRVATVAPNFVPNWWQDN